MSHRARIDHLVLATPDLSETVEELTGSTGVEPRYGGAHQGWGTANYLYDLDEGRYLEIVGPDPGQSPTGTPRPFGIDSLRAARLVTWAARVPDMDRAIARARSLGYDPGPAAFMSRTRADGTTLRWRLTAWGEMHGVVPFLIDWGTSEHPTSQPLPRLELVEFAATHPDPESASAALRALGLDLDVGEGSPGTRCRVAGRKGVVTPG